MDNNIDNEELQNEELEAEEQNTEAETNQNEENQSEEIDFKAKANQLEKSLSAAQAEKENCLAKLRDFNTMYIRLQSEFDNYRKRTTEQLKHTKEDGIAEAITKMIPVLDVLAQALRMINDESVAEGVRMINRQMLDSLNSFGVTEIEALGKPFDPQIHNAVMQVPAENPDMEGMVVEVLQKGYQMGDRILRHSVVKVAR